MALIPMLTVCLSCPNEPAAVIVLRDKKLAVNGALKDGLIGFPGTEGCCAVFKETARHIAIA